MSVLAGLHSGLQHSMRAYYLPLISGLALAASAFMPWMKIGDQEFGGLPSAAGLWVLGLGLLAVVLALLSVVTRRNSRHPLLLVGLSAFAILWLGERFLERSAADQFWARSQAQAIVQGTQVVDIIPPGLAIGAYVGFAASLSITLFGLTIVVRQAARPYAEVEDDDE